MKKEEFLSTLVSVASMTVGAMGSKIAADMIPIENTTVRSGLLVLGGIAGASMLDRKSTAGKIGQDVAISMAVTQTGELIKAWVGDRMKDNKFLAPALASPMDSYMDLDSTNFLSSYGSTNYDFISEDVAYEPLQEFAG